MDSSPIHAVCLDAYGTLCRIGDRRGRYLSLFRLLGVDPRAGARLAMTSGLSLEELARVLVPGHDADLSEAIKDLDAEAASITLFDDAADALSRLRQLGLKLSVASESRAALRGPSENDAGWPGGQLLLFLRGRGGEARPGLLRATVFRHRLPTWACPDGGRQSTLGCGGGQAGGHACRPPSPGPRQREARQRPLAGGTGELP